PGRSFVARSTQTIQPTLINEVGYNFSYGAIISNPTGLVSTANSPDIKVSLPFAVSLDRVPSVSPGFSGVAGFGPYRDFNRNHNIYDNVTKVVGAHTLKFGATLNLYQKTENAAGTNAGSFSFPTTPKATFNDPVTGKPTTTLTAQQGWANFLLGNVSSF